MTNKSAGQHIKEMQHEAKRLSSSWRTLQRWDRKSRLTEREWDRDRLFKDLKQTRANLKRISNIAEANGQMLPAGAWEIVSDIENALYELRYGKCASYDTDESE